MREYDFLLCFDFFCFGDILGEGIMVFLLGWVIGKGVWEILLEGWRFSFLKFLGDIV